MSFVRKEELNHLIKGKRFDEIDEIPFFDIGQGYGYKSLEAFDTGENVICYIPEYCYNGDTLELDPECCYSKADFLKLTGDEEKARRLFESLDWQHPSSLWNEWENEYDDKNG